MFIIISISPPPLSLSLSIYLSIYLSIILFSSLSQMDQIKLFYQELFNHLTVYKEMNYVR